MIVDQTWVGRWGSNVTTEKLLEVARWVAAQKPHVQQLALHFPPHSLVRLKARPWTSLTEAEWESLPVPTTCGVIHSYSADKQQVFVLQSPGDKTGSWVDIEKLELAAPWAGLDRGYLQAVIDMQREQASTKEALPSKELATNGKQRR